MKLLLLKLPYCRHPESKAPVSTNSYRPMPSLALAALSAFVKAYGPRGLEVEVRDVNLMGYAKRLGEFHPGDMSMYLRHALLSQRYDVIGISGAFTHNALWLRDALNCYEHEAQSSTARIVVGGPIVPDGLSEAFRLGASARDQISAIRDGDGETKLLDYLKNLGGSPSPAHDIFCLGQNLHSLPIPDWDAFDLQPYFEANPGRVLPIEASRGCPYDCSYCTVTDTWGSRVRYKGTHQVVREMAAAHERFGAQGFHFIDDNLAFNREWFQHFLEFFRQSRLPVKLDASNFSIKHLDQGLAELMVGCGFKRVSVAVESASPRIQKETRKRLKLEEVPAKIAMLKAAGLRVHICWMVGFPGETKAEIETTFALARQLRAASNQFLTVTPYPGTELYAQAREAGVLADDFDINSLECRGSRPLKNQAWDYDWLEERISDANVRCNFLENPLFTDGAALEMRDFKAYLEGVLHNYPDHVIAEIMMGLLDMKVSPPRTPYWNSAAHHIKSGEYPKAFAKHLNSNHPVMVEFRKVMGL